MIAVSTFSVAAAHKCNGASHGETDEGDLLGYVRASPFQGTLEVDSETIRRETLVIAPGFVVDPISDHRRSKTVV